MKHRSREPSSGVSSARSNFTRAMPGRIPKLSDFSAQRNQLETSQPDSQSELMIPAPTSTSDLQQVLPRVCTTPQNKQSSKRNRHSSFYYGFQHSLANSEITAPPKRPRRAVNVENYQPTNISVVETV